jgi:hypothetical protein
MDLSHEELRREARDTKIENDAAVPRLREALSRLLDRADVTAEEKEQAILGMSRRSALRFGGLTVLGGVLLAACGSDSGSGAGAGTTAAVSGTTAAPGTTAAAPGTTAAAPGSSAAAGSADATILRTASSIEELAVAAYQKGIDSGLVKTPAVVDAAKLFQSQHKEHAGLFQSLTKQAGGTPFTEPNPVLLAALGPTIAALKDERGVVSLAFQLETVAAQTYQSNVATFMDAKLNAAIMSVGGIEARHAAALAAVLKQNPVPVAFQVVDKAVKPGTGVA